MRRPGTGRGRARLTSTRCCGSAILLYEMSVIAGYTKLRKSVRDGPRFPLASFNFPLSSPALALDPPSTSRSYSSTSFSSSRNTKYAQGFPGSKRNGTYCDDNTSQRGNKEGSQLHFDNGFETMRLRRVLQRKRRYLDCQN